MLGRALSLLLAFASSAALAQTTQPLQAPADAAERVRQIFAAYDHTDTPGCAVGVSLGGKEVLRGAWGMADLEHHVALSPDSIFEAGSVSKQFTAAAILLLAEQGKLSLADSVRKYFPELPDYAEPITIDHLLHHTSGLRDWSSVVAVAGWPRTTREYSNAWVLDITSHQKALNYKPGDKWSYTNTGYNLLAMLVQRISGKSLAKFTRDKIFSTLGMSSTSWRDDFQRIVPNRAIAYEKADDNERQLMPFENAYGNGGLLTTVDDLLRWNDRFEVSKIGDSSFVNSELEPGRLNDGSGLFYGAGLFLTDYDGVREISHDGATAGYRALLAFYPDQQLSVALLCNSAEADPDLLGHEVANVYLVRSGGKLTNAPDTVLVSGLEGLYESRSDHSTISIDRKDGKLIENIANRSLPLIPVTATSFRLSPEGPVFQLRTDATGKVTALEVIDFGAKLDTFDRVRRAAPSLAEMGAMTGNYVSDEAEGEFEVVLTPKGLEIHQRPDTIYPLTPTYADGFEFKFGSIRFLRDSRRRVTGLSVGNSRMWDLHFRRVEAK